MASTRIYVYLYRHLMSMNHYESQKVYFIKRILISIHHEGARMLDPKASYKQRAKHTTKKSN